MTPISNQFSQRGLRRAIVLAGALLAGTPTGALSEETCTAADLGAMVVASSGAGPATTRPWLDFAPASSEPARTTGAVLAGIIVPSGLGSDDRGQIASRLGALAGSSVRVLSDEKKPDRNGRVAALVVTADGRNVAADLLEAGLAVFDGTFSRCSSSFSASEDLARRQKRGIWATPAAIIVSKGGMNTALPDFFIIRGRVVSTGRSGRTTYLNFGTNWRTGITVRVRNEVGEALRTAGHSPEDLAGAWVEARGWVERRDGPYLTLPAATALAAARNEDEDNGGNE